MTMRWLERHAWWALLMFAGISIIFGLGDFQAGAPDNAPAVTGMTNEQVAAQSSQAYLLVEDQIRAGGLQLVLIGVLLAAILLYGFRRNQRWAWWVLWSVPAFAVSAAILHLADTAPGQKPPVPVFSGAIVTVLAAAVLLVSAPRFFRRTSSEGALAE